MFKFPYILNIIGIPHKAACLLITISYDEWDSIY
jgi:hypothetical protein